MTHLIKLGQEAKIDKKQINATIDRVRNGLSQWESLAREYGVSKENIKLIGSKISTIDTCS